MSLALTLVSVLVMLSAGAFVTLYSSVTWWRSNTGRNQMAMAACLVLLGAGTASRHFPWGGYSILLAGVLVSVVMVWRTVIMWQATHPRNAPTAEHPVPPPDRTWYSPTPTSIIEPPRRKEH
jgi:hypothetical protein